MNLSNILFSMMVSHYDEKREKKTFWRKVHTLVSVILLPVFYLFSILIVEWICCLSVLLPFFLSLQDEGKKWRSAIALFQSLSRTRSREEALLFGSFTFLPFNTSSSSSPTPPLAFLRSWGCVHFLVLLNLGSEPHNLSPDWAPSLPTGGVFVTSTGMDRLGAVSLDTLTLKPQEAIVIKLFEGGSYS